MFLCKWALIESMIKVKQKSQTKIQAWPKTAVLYMFYQALDLTIFGLTHTRKKFALRKCFYDSRTIIHGRKEVSSMDSKVPLTVSWFDGGFTIFQDNAMIENCELQGSVDLTRWIQLNSINCTGPMFKFNAILYYPRPIFLALVLLTILFWPILLVAVLYGLM